MFKRLLLVVCTQVLCLAQSATNPVSAQQPTNAVSAQQPTNAGLGQQPITASTADQAQKAQNCPVEIVKLDPSHESFLDNMRTSNKYGRSAHNKFLEVKVKNTSDKTIRGIKFVTAFYDSTEDLTTIPHAWGLHSDVKAGEIGTGNWDTNAYQKEAAIGWVVLPWKILYADGTTWQQAGTSCSYEWWKDKKHPKVNKAPKLDVIKNDET